MTDERPATPWLGGATVAVSPLAAMLWLSVPSVLLVAVPTRLAESLWYALPGRSKGLYSVLVLLPYLLVPLGLGWLFIVLCRRIARRPDRARRALAASAILVAGLSVAWYARGWGHGMRYQGAGFIYAQVAASALTVAALAVIAARWRARPGPALPMLFLWLELVWVIGFAFPWMGETW